MIAAIAGPRGQSVKPGPVGGVLGQMAVESDQVCRL